MFHRFDYATIHFCNTQLNQQELWKLFSGLGEYENSQSDTIERDAKRRRIESPDVSIPSQSDTDSISPIEVGYEEMNMLRSFLQKKINAVCDTEER